MDAKKPPMLWRRWGRNEAGKEQLACAHSAGTAREPQEQSCRDCAFLRTVRLPSGRVRRLCMLSGERLTAAATACEHFQPGRWETTWADPDAPKQSLVCALCGHAVAPTRRAALLGATLCRLHRPEARSAAPVACPAFRVRRGEGVRHAL